MIDYNTETDSTLRRIASKKQPKNIEEVKIIAMDRYGNILLESEHIQIMSDNQLNKN